MKRVLILTLCLLPAISCCLAQGGFYIRTNNPIHLHTYPRLRNQVFSIALDYDSADARGYQPAQYISRIFASNMHYSLVANNPLDSGGINFSMVKFDTLVDAATLTSYARNQEIINMTIDTITTGIGQVNHSNTPDTIIVSIFSLQGAGTALWADTIITDSSLSVSSTGFHSWLYGYNLVVPANFTLPSGSNSFGVKLQYFGDKRDTFGIIAGYGDPGLSGCGLDTTKATKSAYYPNSYAYWVSKSALLPDSLGNDNYHDCNNDGKYEAGVDGENFIQNIKMEATVTFTSDLGINNLKSNASILNVYPNPSDGQTEISYSIQFATAVIINIFDVMGKQVQSIEKGTVAPGKYAQPINLSKLAPGIYSFCINTNEGRSFGKIAVTK